MSTKIISSDSPSKTALPLQNANGEGAPSLADIAAVLVPGLQQATALLTAATKILCDLSGHPSQPKLTAAEEAARAYRLLAAFGRPPNRC